MTLLLYFPTHKSFFTVLLIYHQNFLSQEHNESVPRWPRYNDDLEFDSQTEFWLLMTSFDHWWLEMTGYDWWWLIKTDDEQWWQAWWWPSGDQVVPNWWPSGDQLVTKKWTSGDQITGWVMTEWWQSDDKMMTVMTMTWWNDLMNWLDELTWLNGKTDEMMKKVDTGWWNSYDIVITEWWHIDDSDDILMTVMTK